MIACLRRNSGSQEQISCISISWTLVHRKSGRYGTAALHVAPNFAMPPGYVSEATQRAGLEGQVARSAYRVDRQIATTMDEMVEKGYVVIGTPDDVLQQLDQAVSDLNVGHLMMLLQFGNMKKDVVRANTKLFAEKVLPRFKPKFSEWEDRWWPKPMERAARAAVASLPIDPGKSGAVADTEGVQ